MVCVVFPLPVNRRYAKGTRKTGQKAGISRNLEGKAKCRRHRIKPKMILGII
jgi:hypothetical protein